MWIKAHVRGFCANRDHLHLINPSHKPVKISYFLFSRYCFYDIKMIPLRYQKTIKIEGVLMMEEKILKAKPGLPFLILFILLYLLGIGSIIFGGIQLDKGHLWGIPFLVVGILWMVLGIIPFLGLKIIHPNEALVLTLFGKYVGTLKDHGFFFVHPFCSAVNPAAMTKLGQSHDVDTQGRGKQVIEVSTVGLSQSTIPSKKISLKVSTLSNAKQKINDALGNPVEVGVAVIWRVVDTAKAVFAVDNYKEYLSLQADAAVRNIVRIYPYDVAPNIDTTGDGIPDEGSLRGSSETVAKRIRDEIQKRVEVAGLEILEARITYLAYAPEIAAAMLQRQQASAIIDARTMIVEGAVSMVEMALHQLSERDIVELDPERKAAMVSNLLVVLCGNRDAQPVVNSGSLY